MTTASPTTPTSPIVPTTARRLGRAGVLIVAGLVIETITFSWGHPTSFLFFLSLGAGLVVLGVASYLWAIARA